MIRSSSFLLSLALECGYLNPARAWRFRLGSVRYLEMTVWVQVGFGHVGQTLG